MTPQKQESSANMGSELEVISQSAEETRALGARLGERLRGGDIVALIGNLGAGKTTFTQGVGAGLGVKGYLRSPTFTLVNEYRLVDDLLLLHLDGYRLGETMDEAMLEADTFGLSDLLDDAASIVIVEWADRVAAMLPDDRLEVRIEYDEGKEDRRHFTFRARGPHSARLIEHLLEDCVLKKSQMNTDKHG